MRFIKFSKKGM